jgi:MFS family permease
MFAFFATFFLVSQVAQAQIFVANYGFSTLQASLTNLAFFIGQVISIPLSGWVSDTVSMRATRKNSGVREPEMRLPALIPTVILTAMGLVLIGVSIQHKLHWIVPVVGFGVLGVGFVATCTIAVNCKKVYLQLRYTI